MYLCKCERHDDISQLPLAFLICLETQVGKIVTPLLCLQLATDFFLRLGDVLKLGEVQGSFRAVFFLLGNFRKKSS